MSFHIFNHNRKLSLDFAEIPFFFFLLVRSGFPPDGSEPQALSFFHCCHSPSSITKQLISSKEKPSCPGRARIQGHKAWHAPFLFQVFFGLAGFVLCPDRLVVRHLGYHYLLPKSTY